MFFRRLEYKVQYDPKLIISVIKKYQLKITFEEFVEWIKTNKADFRNYIRIFSIRKLFVNHHFAYEETKIMRILFKEFLERESLICFITSKKAKKGVVASNLANRRTIMEEILGEQRPE